MPLHHALRHIDGDRAVTVQQRTETRICTAFIDGEPHGKRDVCTRVVTRDGSGRTVSKHWCCGECRERMGLPEHDVLLYPGGQRPWR